MKGSRTDKSHNVCLELKANEEYVKILKSGGITIDGQLIEAHEFLAPSRIVMYTKCNEPGHIRKNCSFKYYACRRCGGDRSDGDHIECTICCQ